MGVAGWEAFGCLAQHEAWTLQFPVSVEAATENDGGVVEKSFLQGKPISWAILNHWLFLSLG